MSEWRELRCRLLDALYEHRALLAWLGLLAYALLYALIKGTL